MGSNINTEICKKAGRRTRSSFPSLRRKTVVKASEFAKFLKLQVPLTEIISDLQLYSLKTIHATEWPWLNLVFFN